MNPERGDVPVMLDGNEYILRPSFEALVEIEERLGMGLVPLARRFMDGQFGIRDVTAVVAAGIGGSGQRVPDDLGNLVVRAGIMSFAEALGVFLANALQGDASGGNSPAPPQGT